MQHDGALLFAELAATSDAVRETRSRKRKADLLGRGRCRRRLVLVFELGRDRP